MKRITFFVTILMFTFLGLASCETPQMEGLGVKAQEEQQPLTTDSNTTNATESGEEGNSDLGDDD